MSDELSAASAGVLTPRLAPALRGHFGADPRRLPVATLSAEPFLYASYDVAVGLLFERLGDVRHHGLVSAQHLERHAFDAIVRLDEDEVRLGQPVLKGYPSGPGESRLSAASRLTILRYDGVPLAVLARSDTYHRFGYAPQMTIEVLGAPEPAQAFLAEIQRLRLEHNIYRGKALRVEDAMADLGLDGVVAVGAPTGRMAFVPRPVVQRDDVQLPEGVLEQLEESVIGPSRHRERLLAAGQHLKRGVLLYGPPGTGKTHVCRYLASRWSEATVLFVTGYSFYLVREIVTLATALAPALVVFDDVDVIAGSRDIMHEQNALTFELLDAMDGVGPDADVAFILTTNRAAQLEQALLQRPGRIDLAVEVNHPDLEVRRRLLDRYLPEGLLSAAALDAAAAATEGLTASAFKELSRQTILRALDRGTPATPADLLGVVEEFLAVRPR